MLFSSRCRFRIVVIIKSATVDKVKKDRLLENYPCFITIQGQHNHGTMSAQEIRQLRVLPDVKETLEDYFEQGENKSGGRYSVACRV